MASLRSIRAGLSRSYHSLNTMGNIDEETGGGGGGGRENNNTSSTSNFSSSTDWLGVDNFRTKNNNRTSPLSAIKGALSKVSRGRQNNSSNRISTILKELDDEWRISEDGNEGDISLG